MKNRTPSPKLIPNTFIDTDIEKYGGKSMLLNIFDSEPGYYHHIVRPLLTSGHETELIQWLKNTELIKSKQICSRKMANVICNKPMSWVESRGLNLFQWKCKTCLKRKSIKDDSIFNGLSCNFKNAIRIILAWCNGYHVDYLSKMLGISSSAVEELYIRASSVAEKYMKSNISQWQIGGPGIVVVIDTYPEGCTNSSRIRMARPILCISEIKSIPQKYWLEPLDLCGLNRTEHVNSQKQHILTTIQRIVRPGSILIIPSTSTLCSYNDFQQLRTVYPTIISIRDLVKHNNDHQNVFTNLETIWKRILDVCEEAQFYCSSYIDLFIMSHMWRAVYGNEAFEMLLYQISRMQ